MKAMELADYIITIQNKKSEPITNLKLQKIMYFLSVDYMMQNGKSLISDEKFERWDYGPVIRSVYFEYSSNHSDPIKKIGMHVKVESRGTGSVGIVVSEFKKEDLDDEEKNFVKAHIDSLMKFDVFDLVDKSHDEPQWKDLEANKEYDIEKSINYFRSKKFW